MSGRTGRSSASSRTSRAAAALSLLASAAALNNGLGRTPQMGYASTRINPHPPTPPLLTSTPPNLLSSRAFGNLSRPLKNSWYDVGMQPTDALVRATSAETAARVDAVAKLRSDVTAEWQGLGAQLGALSARLDDTSARTGEQVRGSSTPPPWRVCAYVRRRRPCVCACACACVRECACACVWACVCMYVWACIC